METTTLTVLVERERLSDAAGVYVALCLELDLACQGATVEEATENVTDVVKSFFEIASPAEIERRLPHPHSNNAFVTRIEVPLGQTSGLVGA